MLEHPYNDLLLSAKRAALQAYAPYSKYRVGCAVQTDKGIFLGFNIENASTSLGLCAERAAITNALISGAKVIDIIAVYCLDAHMNESNMNVRETMPCGACRQWIAELAPDAKVVTNGSDKIYELNDLLPDAFTFIKS
jgi:cytidine deaminase